MPFMKTLLLSALLLSFVTSGYAQQTCPLTNSNLVDLRGAATRLAKTITLSSECKAYQDTINHTNSQLKDIAYTIADADGKLEEDERPDNKEIAAKAVSHLGTISNLFKDQRCGSELVTFLDYTTAFVDIATNMIPFLANYGGPQAMPWVLGSAIAGAGAKTLILFFQNKNIDMRNSDQSGAFLKNSCAFYHLNQIKESIDDLELRQSPTIELSLKESEKRLNKVKASAFPEPKSEPAMVLKQAEKDQQRIKYLDDQMKADPVEGCGYIKAYAAHEDQDAGSSLVERVWENYEKTIIDSAFTLKLERKFFLDELNATIQSTAAPAAGTAPTDLAMVTKCTKWIAKMNTFSASGIALLKKSSTKDMEIKKYEQWRSEKTALEESINVQRARIKFFEDLTGDGFNIEYSEIIRSHEQVQNSLFDSYRWLKTMKMKGLGEAWLRVKLEDAQTDLSDYEFRKKEVFEKISAIEKTMGARISGESVKDFSATHKKKTNRDHPLVSENTIPELCTQLRKSWTSWYNGLIHARAGKDYCQTFEKVINKLDYPEIQSLCFGTTTKQGRKLANSLRNEVQSFQDHKPEADSLIQKINDYSCKGSSDLSTELLKKTIE